MSVSEAVSEVMSKSEPMPEVFGHVRVRTRVRVRSHDSAHVRVRSPKKYCVRVQELMSEVESVSVHL